MKHRRDNIIRYPILPLTLKRPRYFPPIGAKGVSMGPPFKKKKKKKNTFPAEFCDECYTLHLHTIKNHIQRGKKISKKWFIVSKWRPNYRFLLCIILILVKSWKKKPLSQRNFQWNLYHVRRLWTHLHNWNKNGKFLLLWSFRGKTIFHRTPILIYAN